MCVYVAEAGDIMRVQHNDIKLPRTPDGSRITCLLCLVNYYMGPLLHVLTAFYDRSVLV